MTDHAKFSPSRAATWVNCPASVEYPREVDAGDRAAAEEGRLAHLHAAHYVMNGPEADPLPPTGLETVQMIRAAQHFATLVRHHVRSDVVTHIGVEETLDWHPECWGTPDAWTWDGKTLRVWDFKYGFNPVLAFENWQLIVYACALLDHLRIDGFQEQNSWISLGIYQPRVSPVPDVWGFQATDIRPYRNQILAALDALPGQRGYTTPGEWCRRCGGAGVCQALQATAATLADTAEVPSTGGIGVELSDLRRAAAIIKARLDALEAQAVETIRAGGMIPGWELAPGRGRTEWTLGGEELAAWAEEWVGLPLTRQMPITITAARELGVPQELLEMVTEKKPGALALKPVNLKEMFR